MDKEMNVDEISDMMKAGVEERGNLSMPEQTKYEPTVGLIKTEGGKLMITDVNDKNRVFAVVDLKNVTDPQTLLKVGTIIGEYSRVAYIEPDDFLMRI